MALLPELRRPCVPLVQRCIKLALMEEVRRIALAAAAAQGPRRDFTAVKLSVGRSQA